MHVIPAMGLSLYARKRDFAKTPEPSDASSATAADGPRFVVQQHAARRLHWDFRLEVDGVLKSWAVPKGPSLDPAEKRLAVATEDHPLAYATFEGVIPAGEYGGGNVLLWDRGVWTCQGDPREGLERGRLDFELAGEKLRGGWRLVRLQGRGKQVSWLLMKRRDAQARSGDEAEIVQHATRSVATGRSIEQVDRAPADAADVALLEIVEPQLATLVDAPPIGEAWLHEFKYDGYRLSCRGDGQSLRWTTRTGQDWTAKFSALSRALEPLARRPILLDGEVVVLDAQGRSDFGALQHALSTGAGTLVFFAFDLPYLDGEDLREQPLLARKQRLAELVREYPSVSALRYSDHVIGHGATFLAEACRLGLEGIVSKRVDAPYRSGRGRSWLKVKCRHRQEVVVVGWAPGRAHREALGALLLAVHDERGSLRYVGKVGTGFDATRIEEVRAELDPLERSSPALAVDLPPRERKHVHWVEPSCVAEIEFQGWTRDGHVRQASFVGLRLDKPATDVRREVASPLPKVPRGSARSEVAGVTLTHPDKLLFPAVGLTKSDLAAYYEGVAELMLPQLRGRPLTLVRCPDGHPGECFHQKRANRTTPRRIPRVAIKPGVDYLHVQELADLVALVQMGVLEIHVWGSRCEGPGIGFPDVLVFDLDPDEDVTWAHVVATAEALRDRLAQLGLAAFARSTGGKGIHVVTPIEPSLTWAHAKTLTHAIALEFVRHAPEHYTDRLTKSRRKGKIFIDYLRNAAEATAIASYSVRAREGALVAAPIDWAELQATSGAPRYDVDAVVARVAQGIDPWRGFDEARRAVSRDVLRSFGIDPAVEA